MRISQIKNFKRKKFFFNRFLAFFLIICWVFSDYQGFNLNSLPKRVKKIVPKVEEVQAATQTITYVAGSATSTNINYSTTTIYSFMPLNSQVGDLLLMWVVTDSNSLLNNYTGWNLIGSRDGSTDSSGHLFYRVADGTEGTSWKFNNFFSTTEYTYVMTSAWRGVSTTDPINFSTSSAVTANTISGPSFKPSRDNTMIIQFAGCDPGSAYTATDDNSAPDATEIWDNRNGSANYGYIAAQYYLETTAVTVAMDYTFSATDSWEYFQIALNPGFVLENGGATVSSVGTQNTSLLINSSSQYIGGAFSIVGSNVSTTVTSISLTESGAIDAATDLDNIKLFYDLDTSSPYNCESESYGGSETQYGSTDTDGFSSANTSTFTGSVAVSSTQALCIYPVLDVGSGASSDETVELEIANPSTDVLLSFGSATPATAIAISGTSYLGRVSYLQYDTNTSNATTTVTCTTTVAATSGNLLVTAVGTDKSAGAYTVPTGFTELKQQVGTSVSGAWAYKVSDGTESVITWTQSTANDMTCWVGEYDGLATSNVLDVSASSTSGETVVTSLSSGTTATTADANEFVLSFFTADTYTSVSAGRAWTNNFVESIWVDGIDYGAPIIVAAKETTSTGQQETTFSTTGIGDQMLGFIAAFKFPTPSTVTVGTSGTQTASVNFPKSDQYVGGVFTIANSGTTKNVNSISIAETGTVDAAADLDNIKLFYDLDITAPYDCASESYDGGESQFGSTDTDGFSANNTSTFTGSVEVSSSQTICVYPVVDVGSGASTNETLEIEITNPSINVLLNSGTASPGTTIAISGSTTLIGPSVVVSTLGIQESTVNIPIGGQYVGGAFSLLRSNSTTVEVNEISIQQTGTVSGDTELDNIKLFYEFDNVEPYDCASKEYNGSESQFGDTDIDGFSAGTQMSTFIGSASVSSTRAMCVYVVLDVLDTADDGDTIEISINNPSADVVVSSGDVTPGTSVEISGTTELNLPPDLKQAHYRWRNDNGYESDFDTGDGADGNLNLSSNFNLNTQTTAIYPDGVAYRVGSISGSQIGLRNAAGSTLANANGIIAGDDILIINLQGEGSDYGSTGNYEFLKVQSVSGGTITVSSAPTKDYDGSGNSFSNQKVFVQRIPNYTNVTTGANSITAGAWDNGLDHDDSGCTDNQYTGIVAFRANGVVTVSSGGAVSANALGYSGGGTVYGAGSAAYSYQGVSASGTGANLRTANMGGGGGGKNDTVGSSTSGASGGGGGYGTTGTAGNDSPEDSNSGGLAGGTYGDSALSQIFLGSGGGGGGGDRNGETYVGGTNGSAGGGIVMIMARYMNVSGSVSSNGASSTGSSGQYYGSGGAGSGGSVYLASVSSTLGTNLVTASGGTGGCGATGRCGGNGGSGRVRIAMSVYSGSSSPSASVTTTPTGQLTAATFAFAEDTPYTNLSIGSKKRLRFLINNDGSDAGNLNYVLEYAQHADCASGSYIPVPLDDSADWKVSATSYIMNGETSVNLGGVLSDPTGQSFIYGNLYDSTNTLTVNLPALSFTEVEFSVNSVAGNADAGTQYCFRLSTDSQTLTYDNYAIANMVSAGNLVSDIVNVLGESVVDPFVVLSTTTLSFLPHTVTGVLGLSDQKVRVSNGTISSAWTLTLSASSVTDLWTGLYGYYDFNDSTASSTDGMDADNYGGQLTIDPSEATITPQSGCSLTGLTLSNSTSFSEGVVDSATLMAADESAGVNCYWDLTGVALSQDIPAEQVADVYSLNMVITVTSI